MSSENSSCNIYTLDKLYDDRLDNLSNLGLSEKMNLRDIMDIDNQLDNCILEIENINLRNQIKSFISTLKDILQQEDSYHQEKFYKYGFSDGVSLFLDCMRVI